MTTQTIILCVVLTALAITTITFLFIGAYFLATKKVFWGFMEGAAYHFIRGSSDGAVSRIFYQEDLTENDHLNFLQKQGLRWIGIWPIQTLVGNLEINVPKYIGDGTQVDDHTIRCDHLLAFSPIVLDFRQIDVGGFAVSMSVTLELEVPSTRAANQLVVVKRGKGYLLALQAIRQAADNAASTTSIDDWRSSTGRQVVDQALKDKFRVDNDGFMPQENVDLLNEYGCRVTSIMVTDHEVGNVKAILQKQEEARLEGEAKVIEAKKGAEARRVTADADLYVETQRGKGMKQFLNRAGIPNDQRRDAIIAELRRQGLAQFNGQTLVIGTDTGVNING